MTPILATSNIHKAREFKKIFRDAGIALKHVSLKTIEIQSERLEDIAVFSSLQAFEAVGRPVFVEDAGLFIESLDGFPGPYSSYVYRTIGLEGVLRLVGDDREARFVSVISYYDGRTSPHIFRGEVHGRIAERPRGRYGFGFDPIFIPEGSDKTFAEMSRGIKTGKSHRGLAARRFIAWLRGQG
ncbi:Non-canonical purine NTP pyrophosphatase [archaeon HR01]|nr:Non-canonical purine NTP pyrophosphatase [archaeon HR01]